MIQTVLLGDLVDISSSKRIFYKEYVSSGVPFYRSKEIIERAAGRKDISTELFISKERFNEIESKFGAPQEGDLLLTSVGTLGIPYLVQKNEKFYFKDGNLTWFRNFKPQLNRSYLLYWLTSQDGKNELLNHTIGSTQKALTIQGLKKVKVPLPNIETQNKIADILGTIDEKIELNRKMNETLEQMGQALFRRYFIDNPEADKWGKVKIGELVNIKGGGTPSTKNPIFWDGDIAWTSPRDLTGKNDVYLLTTGKKITRQGLSKVSSGLLPEGVLLLSSRAPIGYVAITGLPLSINQGYIAFLPNAYLSNHFMYFWLKQNMERIENAANGSTFMEISKSAFRNITTVKPSEESLQSYKNEVAGLFDAMRNNQEQIQTLTTLRDTLLPRLINGKVKL